MTPDFLIRPHPSRMEGPQGYLMRLAEANYLRLNDIRQMGGRYEMSWLEKQMLLPRDGLYPQLIEHINRVSTLWTSTPRIWNTRYPRFCPKCLTEHGVWHASWEIMFHDACSRHQTWLVDKCSSCHQAIQWSREFVFRCQCGADLRNEKASEAPQSVVGIARVLEASLTGGPDIECPEPLAGLALEQIQRLVRYLGGYMDAAKGPKPLKLKNAGQLDVSWPVVTLAAEIIAHWPALYHQCWSQMHDEKVTEKTGLNGTFKQAYYHLYKGLKEAQFEPVRKEFELWLSEHWKGGVSLRNRRLSELLIDRVQWIPAKIAAEKLKTSLKRVKDLIKEGHIDGQRSISTTGRTFFMVRRDQLDAIDDHLINQMTLTEAMSALGLGKVRMRRVVRVLLPGARRMSNAPSLPWCVPRDQVEAILDLGRHAEVVHIPEENQVSMGHALRYWSWNAEDVLNLVEAVKRGVLSIEGQLSDTRGVSGWLFSEGKLKSWRARHQDANSFWLSIPKLAKLLGIKQQMAYWLIAHNIIPTVRQDAKSGRAQAMVRKEEVAIFQQKYVFATEIARVLETSPNHAIKLLAKGGIKTVYGYGDSDSPQKLFRRCESLNELVSELLSGRPAPLPLLPIEELALRSDDSCK